MENPGQSSAARAGVPDGGHRQRRPTGAPPPLPNSIGLIGKLWLGAVLVVVVSGTIWLHFTTGPLDRIDAVLIRLVTSMRTAWLDSLASNLNSVGSRWGLATWGLLTAAMAVVFYAVWPPLIVGIAILVRRRLA